MRTCLTLLFVYFYALLSSGTTTSNEDRQWLVSLVELVELDYEDYCEQRAAATWSELIGNSTGLTIKLERDKAFGIFAQKQTKEIRSALTAHALSADDDILRRKVKLLLQPGDTLLDTKQWLKLVTFADTALHKLRFATDYDCGSNSNCSLRELQNSMAKQQNEEILHHMKQSWDNKLPNLTEYVEQILPLLRNASKENNYNTVEEYWDSLAEYEGSTLKVRELWDNIKPLYIKLHNYVALKLKGVDAVGKPLPAHLFRSLTGDDWSNLIENLLPKHPDIYKKLYANLHLKDLGGMNVFKAAAKLIKDLNFGDVETDLWKESIFNDTCPTTFVDSCKPNKLRVVTCKDVTIGNYIAAHEDVMKIKYKQITALHSNNSYIFREANRFSAVYDAIPGFASLLALNPHALDRAGLYPIERFSYNQNHHRLVLQLITALRDLPRLNYYLAADEWRLKLLMGTIPASKALSSWGEFRKNFSLIETSDGDLLGDPYILFNKPFIGKFMGLILKYQIYQAFAEELVSDESDLIQHVADNNQRIMDSMMQGYGVIWPDMVSEILAKRENSLEYTGLTDYYRLLDEYLDNQLDPANENSEEDEYVEPDTVEPDHGENEIPTYFDSAEEKPKEALEADETHENIVNNIIETGDEIPSKFGIETSTVGVLEIKNPVGNEDQNQSEDIKEASYNTYWWIGIIVALAIIVVFIAIIARKRHNHRKQLEKQRRNNTSA